MTFFFCKFIGPNMKSMGLIRITALLVTLILTLPNMGRAGAVNKIKTDTSNIVTSDGIEKSDGTGVVNSMRTDHTVGKMDRLDQPVQISMGEFLSTAFKDPSLTPQSERIRFLKEAPWGVLFIEDPEFRVSIDQFESNRQKYALRVKPRGWNEIKGEKAVQNATIHSEAIQLESLLHTALKNRYLTVIDLLYLSKMTPLHEALNLLHEDWEHVLKRHVDTPDFDAKELADIENQRMILQMDLMELKNQQEAVAEKINMQSGRGDGVHITFSRDGGDFLSVDQLWDRTLSRRIDAVDKNIENIYLTQAKTEVAKADAQYRLEVAEKNRLISFVEAAYNADDEFEDAFSIEFGISIPIGSSNRNTLRQRKLESMKSRSEQLALERQMSQTIPVIWKKLHHLIEQYSAIQQKKENSFSTTAFDRLLQTEGTDPLTLLTLKEGMVRTDILQARLSYRIFTTYIDLLDITGKLSEKPLINHLSSDDQEPLTR